MGFYITVDLGGTQVRGACYEANKPYLEKPSPIVLQHKATKDSSHTPLEQLTGIIAEVWPSSGSVLGICIAAPGPVDSIQGIVFNAPNVPGWIDFPLKSEVAARFPVPVVVGNDANLACLAEWKFGAGKGHHNVVYLTVSTGVGGGVIVNDRLLLGNEGLAAELGHTLVDPNGDICSCGFAGHLEAYSSGTAIAKYVLHQLRAGANSSLPADENLSARVIADAAFHGDALAVSAFRRAGNYLGMAIANFLHTFNPTIVVVGGGVSHADRLLLDPLWESLKKRVFHPRYLEGLTIELAALGDDVGLLGAFALAEISLPTP